MTGKELPAIADMPAEIGRQQIDAPGKMQPGHGGQKKGHQAPA